MSVTAIAKRTGTKAKEVKTALAVAENATAASAIHEHTLTLDQAAVLIEFDDDPEARAQLIDVATHDPAQFAHTAQRARDDRARAKVKADTEADLTARGFEVLDRDRGYYETDYTRLNELVTAEGDQSRRDLLPPRPESRRIPQGHRLRQQQRADDRRAEG